MLVITREYSWLVLQRSEVARSWSSCSSSGRPSRWRRCCKAKARSRLLGRNWNFPMNGGEISYEWRFSNVFNDFWWENTWKSSIKGGFSIATAVIKHGLLENPPWCLLWNIHGGSTCGSSSSYSSWDTCAPTNIDPVVIGGEKITFHTQNGVYFQGLGFF